MTLNVPHVPPGSFHHPVATHNDVQIPKTRITNTPQLRTKSLDFSFSEIPFVKIFTLVKINIPRFFLKIISPEIFPGSFTKRFSGKPPVRNFPKMPHRTIRQSPTSGHCLM